MKQKYLPIGTICTLKGKNKKTMIVGFFSIEYNGNVIMYDYCGYDYPEGLLLNKKYSFNHTDIEKIDYIGYITEEHKIFNNNMLKQNSKENRERNDLKTNGILKNIKFDSNGVVIFDQLDVKTIGQQNSPIENKKTFNERVEQKSFIQLQNTYPSNIIENSNNSKNWNIFKNIKFDENGIVTEIEEYSQEELKNMKEKNNNN